MKKTLFFLSLIYFFSFFSSYVISSEISVVDINYLLKNSNKGKSIQNEIDKLNSASLKKFKTKKKTLEDKEKKIASKKNVLSKEDFNKEVLQFRKEVEKYEIERRKSSQEITNIRINRIAKLVDEINKILVKYSSENSISSIIDKKNVLITKQENDITQKILKALNK
tara:strand:- start:3018 stop:3518 length:501 start_codon:yes stop_codon:yes gene_type:complete